MVSWIISNNGKIWSYFSEVDGVRKKPIEELVWIVGVCIRRFSSMLMNFQVRKSSQIGSTARMIFFWEWQWIGGGFFKGG